MLIAVIMCDHCLHVAFYFPDFNISPQLNIFSHNRTVDHRGVCEAADKFNQTFKHWKFAFHKDQDMVEYQSVHQTEDTLDDEIQMTSV